VRQLDLVSNSWPESERARGHFPQAQYYVLMSVAGCFTDFHIDFGGTSVWYHVLKGRKVFLLVPPSEANLAAYAKWSSNTNQADVFFGDLADRCFKVVVDVGQTLLIPCGWIHAVMTPIDSLVFGGNFLTANHMEGQLRCHALEKQLKIKEKFCFPFFRPALWFACAHALALLRINHQTSGGGGGGGGSSCGGGDVGGTGESLAVAMNRATLPAATLLSRFECEGYLALVRACRQWHSEETRAAAAARDGVAAAKAVVEAAAAAEVAATTAASAMALEAGVGLPPPAPPKPLKKLKLVMSSQRNDRAAKDPAAVAAAMCGWSKGGDSVHDGVWAMLDELERYVNHQHNRCAAEDNVSVAAPPNDFTSSSISSAVTTTATTTSGTDTAVTITSNSISNSDSPKRKSCHGDDVVETTTEVASITATTTDTTSAATRKDTESSEEGVIPAKAVAAPQLVSEPVPELSFEPAVSQPALSSEPAVSQPASELAVSQPAFEPAVSQPASGPAVLQPASEPAVSQPASESAVLQPSSESSESAVSQATSESAVTQPASEPAVSQPAVVKHPPRLKLTLKRHHDVSSKSLSPLPSSSSTVRITSGGLKIKLTLPKKLPVEEKPRLNEEKGEVAVAGDVVKIMGHPQPSPSNTSAAALGRGALTLKLRRTTHPTAATPMTTAQTATTSMFGDSQISAASAKSSDSSSSSSTYGEEEADETRRGGGGGGALRVRGDVACSVAGCLCVDVDQHSLPHWRRSVTGCCCLGGGGGGGVVGSSGNSDVAAGFRDVPASWILVPAATTQDVGVGGDPITMASAASAVSLSVSPLASSLSTAVSPHGVAGGGGDARASSLQHQQQKQTHDVQTSSMCYFPICSKHVAEQVEWRRQGGYLPRFSSQVSVLRKQSSAAAVSTANNAVSEVASSLGLFSRKGAYETGKGGGDDGDEAYVESEEIRGAAKKRKAGDGGWTGSSPPRPRKKAPQVTSSRPNAPPAAKKMSLKDLIKQKAKAARR